MPDFGWNVPQVEVTDEEDRLMEAQMARYAPFRPSTSNFREPKRYVKFFDTQKRMGLVSEEPVQDRILKNLPTDPEAAEEEILRRLAGLASNNSASLNASEAPSNDSPGEGVGSSEEAMEALAFSRLFKGKRALDYA